MNRLSIEDRAKIIGCFIEGVSMCATPAMEAKVSDHVWSLEEIAALAN